MDGKKITTSFIILLAVLFFTTGASAQYFGRNKVQYDDFDFKILKTKNFDIYFYPSETEAVKDVGPMMERWYTRFSSFFNHEIKFQQPLILYANHADFQQTNVIGGIISPATGGVTEGLKNRIVLPLTGVYASTDHVLGHELVHAFQYDIVRSEGASLGAMNQLPLWFIEGMAEYLSIGREKPLTAMWLRDAVLHNDVPTIEMMTVNPKYFPYRYGHAFWAFVAGYYGDDIIPVIYRTVMKTENLNVAFKKTIGDSMKSLSKKWISDVKETYRPKLIGRTKPQDVGQQIITKEGGFNLAPAVSPDGKYMVYLSRRDLFTIDFFLANARTGKVLKKLVSSSTDSHFDALRFTETAGSWSPDGELFAFAVFKDGDNAIAILDVDSRDVKKTIKVTEVDALNNLAWSPDGRKLVFSGSAGGISDLYLYSWDHDELGQLTDDKFADLQPAWSPDGETIAFVTDRGSGTDFEKLTYSPMRLALYDVESGDLQLIAMSKEVKHINPQFSPDGKSVYFISDPGGFSNIYRYSRETLEFFQVTNVATGITGITEMSPAMSVAQKNGRMMFSVFENTNYNIYALEADQTLGESIRKQEELVTDSALPPEKAEGQGLISEYLRKPAQGLPIGMDENVTKYDPSLRLISVGRTGLGVSVDRFGTALGGAVSFTFSDMLGNQVLGAAAQINGGIQDLGGQVLYQNRDSRWNWGGVVGHIPFLTGFTSVSDTTITEDGQEIPATNVDLVEQRVFTERASFFTEYPLSTNRRFEFSAGYTRLSYNFDVERVIVVGDQAFRPDEDPSIDEPSPLNLAQGAAAYVGDYSFFGFTSPIRGKRFRIELEPTAGTLNYLSVLADYRQYLFARPFTFAFRGMHFGRYFGDSDDNRLNQLFVGFETLVRGYSVHSFNAAESGSFANLLGSRIAVVNAEFRIPLFGTRQFGLVNFPILPTELSLFFDGGLAWSDDTDISLELSETPDSLDERIPVFSTGIAARINLFGALPLQFYYAVPFQRPESSGEFGFLFAPGW
ncbi:BamA/TamA family outer membrane protein [candidate division KSB1 bacterium]|nr:BamA/TamA family outer membrane protein [candidate division KSB1 bacterium]NIR68485.1 BamA/TamA family outer membrane protein [candidate division KSB1 bacterium]NIS22499.1 BamA/TamA family outer membrane protein [candidate division KSB1 bacterium]NIT69343.1 BamA/TamA family outer membrane protein [candidate division KSB1 bacterium]NIU23004.1 BamA/TamA family outer membrane protein [candidate division KSB1 bacterium]